MKGGKDKQSVKLSKGEGRGDTRDRIEYREHAVGYNDFRAAAEARFRKMTESKYDAKSLSINDVIMILKGSLMAENRKRILHNG